MTRQSTWSFIAVLTCAGLLSSCASAPYGVVHPGEYQISGHPFKTATNCERKAPIGKFDRQCDIPIVGYRNFSDPTIGIQSGGGGGFSVSGF